MNIKETNQISIDLDKVTLRFGEMEPVVIPRCALRTRLRLIDWIYRLAGWPGMNVQRLRAFIGAIFRHHGWSLPDPKDDPVLNRGPQSGGELETANGNARSSLTSETSQGSASFQSAAEQTRRGELAA